MPVRRWLNVGVGIGCVVVLATLVVCGIHHLREDARRHECRNQLKQFGIAFQNYHDQFRVLPPAFWSSSGWGWQATLQPYLAASPVYSWLKVGSGRLGDWSQNPRRGDFIRIPAWADTCPSDTPIIERATALEPIFFYRGKGEDAESRRDITNRLRVFQKTAVLFSNSGERHPIAISNYVAVYGDNEIDCPKTEGTGLFWQNSNVSLDSDVTDGLSTTLMLGERDGSIHLAGNWAGTSYDENDPDACLDPQFVVDALVDSRPINGRDERCFSSRHPGGAHFLMADGAVKFLSEKCSTTILRRLANRADGVEVLQTDIATAP